MTAVSAVNPKLYFPSCPGGSVDVYVAGSTARSNSWQDRAQTTLNTNPIILDARGECIAWLNSAIRYKFVVKNSAGVTIYTVDNLAGAEPGAATLTQFTTDTFSGTGAKTAFTLSVTPGNENATSVYVGGVYQQKNAYSVAGTTLTFSVAPVLGTNNVEVVTASVLDYTDVAADIAASVAAAAASAASAAADSASADSDAAAARTDRLLADDDVIAAQAAMNSAIAIAAASANIVPFATKAAANTGLAALANGVFVLVLADESRGGWRSLYLKTGGVYVFQAYAPDVTSAALTERDGYGRRMRNTQTTAAMLDRQAFGKLGGGRDLPTAITASQSGVTVTASSAIFTKEHVGNIIVWTSGEEAVITDVNNEASSWVAITTCTVDRSQTVANGVANIDAKPLVCCAFGDSVAYQVIEVLVRQWYRAFGFGGYIIGANRYDSTEMGIGSVTLASGAAETSNELEYGTFPWSVYWSVPSGGTLVVSLANQFSVGTELEYRFGLKTENLLHDTAVIVWRRGAGAFTVERRRFHDLNWELVDTIADASTGARAFNFKKYTHSLRSDWEYRVTGTSGTVKFEQVSFLNRTTPGFVFWQFNRGGELISSFDALPSADLQELCQINMPDFRTVFASDTTTSTNPDDYYTTLAADRTLWATAAPRMDNVWIANWLQRDADDTGALKQRAFNTGMQRLALTYDENFVSFDTLFGPYASSASARGWLRDSIHSTKKGQAITAEHVNHIIGLDEHPLAADGRNINARSVIADAISLRGRDVLTELIASKRQGATNRGAKWVSGTCRLNASTALSAALGSTDFTLQFDMDVLTSAATTQILATISSNTTNTTAQAGAITINQESGDLVIYLTNGSAATYKYVYNYFGALCGGIRRTVAIRSNRARGWFDVFIDGKPAYGLVASGASGGAGDALATWVGTGQDIAFPQSTAANSCSYFYGARAWLSALSDAQVYAAALTGLTTATPEFQYDFDECGGRMVLDKSGNGRDAMFQASNPNQYSIGAGPTWKGIMRQFSPPWISTINANAKLLSGDDVTHQYAGGRDFPLPDTPKVNDMVRVTKQGAFTVRITQPALHQIKTGAGGTVGTNATTIGVGGVLTIVGAYDSVTLKCVKASAGVAYEWAVVAASSALTWT